MGKGKILRGAAVFAVGATAVTGGICYKIFQGALMKGYKLPMMSGPDNLDQNVFDGFIREGKAWALAHKNVCTRLTMDQTGLELVGYYYDQGADKTVILVHGWTGSYTERLADAPYYYDKGFNILAVECRGHGESEGKYRTMGYWDSKDVVAWANYLVRYRDQESIYLDGVSMGGATVLAASGEKNLPKEVKGIIGDCSYTSTRDVFAFQIKKTFHLPVFPFLNIFEYYCNHLADISLDEDSPIEAVQQATTPILFIHGTGDKMVPYAMAKSLCRVCKAPHKLLSVKGAGHGEARHVGREDYEQAMETFFGI